MRIGRPIFVPYRSAQFTLRDDDKHAFSIGWERKNGGMYIDKTTRKRYIEKQKMFSYFMEFVAL